MKAEQKQINLLFHRMDVLNRKLDVAIQQCDMAVKVNNPREGRSISQFEGEMIVDKINQLVAELSLKTGRSEEAVSRFIIGVLKLK